jgi:hypothetical protein
MVLMLDALISHSPSRHFARCLLQPLHLALNNKTLDVNKPLLLLFLLFIACAVGYYCASSRR